MGVRCADRSVQKGFGGVWDICEWASLDLGVREACVREVIASVFGRCVCGRCVGVRCMCVCVCVCAALSLILSLQACGACG